MKLIHELTNVFALLIWAGAVLCFIAFGLAPEDPSNVKLNKILDVLGYSFNCRCCCDCCNHLPPKLKI
jgi:hypothetical protein